MKLYIQRLLPTQSPQFSKIATRPNRRAPGQTAPPAHEPLRYCAGVPLALLHEKNDLLDEIAHFAFDTLGVQQLELHVRDCE